jgi:WD40-like Beta Propeller Repeat
MNVRVAAFAVVVAISVAVPAAWFAFSGSGVAQARTQSASAPAEVQMASAPAALLREPHVLFRDTALDADYGHLAIVPRSDLHGRRIVLPLVCDRIDFRAGHGICLQTHQGVFTTYDAVLLNAKLQPVHTIRLPGASSRARMSPNGRLAAYTVFVTGDSYAGTSFSTRTGIVDTATGKQLFQLEQLTVLRDGKRIHAADFNFWGVTFAADSNHFYATLATHGHHYLVGGSVSSRTVRVLRDGVECPSLSPDGTRIAFKQRMPNDTHVEWRPAVLDVRTLKSHLLPEPRSVDDQIAWLDDQHVAYGIPEPQSGAEDDVWVVPADGSSKPVRLLRDAWSPSFVG